jgi:hypothetical protein
MYLYKNAEKLFVPPMNADENNQHGIRNRGNKVRKLLVNIL